MKKGAITRMWARVNGKGRIPLALKVLYTAFTAVLVPCYWYQYGPLTFLWFCDVAMIVTLFALWLESPLLTGTQAVAILLPQLAWNVDFVGHLVTGKSLVLDFSTYMFNPEIHPFFRALSSFH